MIKARLTLEVACNECNGDGVFESSDASDIPNYICSECNGTGYSELKISLQRLKWLLDGDDL
jgi:DnaJ-class molecular chaperone